MKLLNVSAVVFCLIIVSPLVAVGAPEEFASRKLFPRGFAKTEESAERNGFWSLPFSPFRRKKGDSLEAGPDSERPAEDVSPVKEEQVWQAFREHYRDELPLVSHPLSGDSSPDPALESQPAVMPSDFSTESSPDISPEASPEVTQFGESPEPSLVAPSLEAFDESPDEQSSAVASEEEPSEISVPQSEESQSSFVMKEDKRPYAEPSISGPGDAKASVPVVSPAVDDGHGPSREEEDVSTLPVRPLSVEELEGDASGQVSAPEDNNHRHHISHNVKIVSWTLAGICISLVVVGNFLGIYFSYIRPRLVAHQSEYTAL